MQTPFTSFWIHGFPCTDWFVFSLFLTMFFAGFGCGLVHRHIFCRGVHFLSAHVFHFAVVVFRAQGRSSKKNNILTRYILDPCLWFCRGSPKVRPMFSILKRLLSGKTYGKNMDMEKQWKNIHNPSKHRKITKYMSQESYGKPWIQMWKIDLRCTQAVCCFFIASTTWTPKSQVLSHGYDVVESPLKVRPMFVIFGRSPKVRPMRSVL